MSDDADTDDYDGGFTTDSRSPGGTARTVAELLVKAHD
jgi:hypothetical protein